MQQPNINEQNSAVIGWKDGASRSIKGSYVRLIKSAGRSGDGLDSLKMRTKQHYGEVDQVTLTFKRYLVWVHKGAGKGVGGNKGSTWKDKKAIKKVLILPHSVKLGPVQLGIKRNGLTRCLIRKFQSWPTSWSALKLMQQLN